MPVSRFAATIAAPDAGTRLDAFLERRLPEKIREPLSRSAIRRLIMAGAVTIAGRPVRRPGMALEAGARLQAFVDLSRLVGRSAPHERGEAAGEAAAGTSASIEILYRDRWLLAVAKPAGLLVHASADARRPDLFSRLLGVLDDRQGAAGPPYLGLHHRLDVETSGVMLFTLDPAANEPLARAFAGHEVEKVYHAIVARPAWPVPGRWTERASLAMSGTGRRARMSAVATGGLAAETGFEIVRRLPAALLVEARPKSGRKHQVRAHLCARGLPILGDERYGGASRVRGVRVPRVMLHALSLRLRHPVTGAPLELRCPYPRDFADLLSRLA